jgi:limonene-1,2-epoxide hydrolase
MNDHQLLVERFYRAFQQRDGRAMSRCYHPAATFSDPVFPQLQGPDVGRMWRMLCAGGKDLQIEFSAIEAAGGIVTARWEARYTFSGTGRPVHNKIAARFEFQDGLIVRHRDDFDFHRWAAQALGLAGLLLGWTPMLRAKVRRMAAGRLEKFSS